MNEIAHTQEQYGLRPAAKDFPMMVVLSFTYVCNAACPNCPYNNSDIRKNYRDALFMPDDLFKRIADECAAHNCLLRISGGGEPMLHPRAVDLMEYAKAKGCGVGLITNGSHFSRESFERLIRAQIDAIEFSVDAGNEKEYGKARPGLDWHVLNAAVRLAKQLRDELKSPTRLISSIINQKGIDVAEAESYWQLIVDKVQIRKYLTWGYNVDCSLDATPYLPPHERIPCPWLFERLNIDSRGDVTLCGEDIAFSECFANVNQVSIRDIWLGENFRSLRQKHIEGKGNEISICAHCPDWKYRSWQYNYWKVLNDAKQTRQ